LNFIDNPKQIVGAKQKPKEPPVLSSFQESV